MKSFIKKYWVIIVAIVIAVTAASGVFWYTSQPAYGILGFGGQISQVFYCTCSDGILLTISAPGPAGTYVYQGGLTQVYPYGRIYAPGAQALGTYSPGGVCLYVTGPTCSSQSVTRGTILMVGTSQ